MPKCHVAVILKRVFVYDIHVESKRKIPTRSSGCQFQTEKITVRTVVNTLDRVVIDRKEPNQNDCSVKRK